MPEIYKEFKISGVQFKFTYKNVKRMNIRVHEDQTVHVSAPASLPMAQVREILTRELPAIKKHLEKAGSQPQGIFDGTRNGYTHLLGKHYTVSMHENAYTPTVVWNTKGGIDLHVPKAMSPAARLKALEDWLVEQYKHLIAPALLQHLMGFNALDTAWEVCEMAKWGDGEQEGNIVYLNRELSKLPQGCTEYVFLRQVQKLLHPEDFEAYAKKLLADPQAREHAQKLDQGLIQHPEWAR